MDIHEHLKAIDFLVVAIYLVILTGIGIWVSFRKKKQKDGNLFLAGKSLKWPSIGLTMWGTNVGPSMLIASAGIGYTSGIVAGNFSWFAFPFIFLLAFLFGPLYKKTGISTLPEFIGRRFNESTSHLLAWYSIVTILISWLGLTLYAGGILVGQIMNWPLWSSVLLIIIIAAFFSIAGGLEAIAYTNVFQMSLLIFVSFLFVIIGLGKIDNLQEAFHSTPESWWKLLLPSDNKEFPWTAIIFGYPILGIWFWCTDQSMVQSVLGAKNLKQAQLGANFTAWLKILDVPLFILPGIICFLLYPGLNDSNEAYMTLVTGILPVGLVGLIMAVLIAALVSTVDSALNSLSTIFTLDIYVKKFKPQASTKETVFIGRLVNLLGALLGVLIALIIARIESLDLFSLFQAILGFLAPPITTVFLVGVIWKKSTPFAANVILSVGSLLSIITGGLFLSDYPSKEFWPHFLMLSFYITVALSVIMLFISLLTGKNYEGSKIFETGQPKNYKLKAPMVVLMFWGALIVAMLGLYILFN